MTKAAPFISKSRGRKGDAKQPQTLSVEDVERYAVDWCFDGEFRSHTSRTLEEKRRYVNQFIWWLKHANCTEVGASELRRFLAYVRSGHEEEGGRWGNPRNNRPMRPGTILQYWRVLHALFNWIEKEGYVEENPMDRIDKPVYRQDQIRPFTDEELKSLIDTARNGTHPRRDEAILLMLLDTGLRASEIISIKVADVDMHGRNCSVLGKGNKRRTVYFGRDTYRAVYHYLNEKRRPEGEYLFLSDRGENKGEPLTRSGLAQLLRRLGKRAGIQAARCSPHTMRHSFAIRFLRDGGNVFSLQQMMGHQNLSTSQNYIKLAQTDVQEEHRKHSPADRLRAGR